MSLEDFFSLARDCYHNDMEPRPDILRCPECGKDYPLKDCPTITDGDWEFGYYDMHLCPVNEEHEAEYDYSEEQIKKHEEWEAQKRT